MVTNHGNLGPGGRWREKKDDGTGNGGVQDKSTPSYIKSGKQEKGEAGEERKRRNDAIERVKSGGESSAF